MHGPAKRLGAAMHEQTRINNPYNRQRQNDSLPTNGRVDAGVTAVGFGVAGRNGLRVRSVLIAIATLNRLRQLHDGRNDHKIATAWPCWRRA